MQGNRLKRIALRLYRADKGCVLIAESLKLLDAQLGLIGRNAGQESADGLRVESQTVVRMPGCLLHLANGPPQPNILRLQGRKNAPQNDLQSTGQDRQPFHVEDRVYSRSPDHFDQMAQQTESGHVGHGGCAGLLSGRSGRAARPRSGRRRCARSSSRELLRGNSCAGPTRRTGLGSSGSNRGWKGEGCGEQSRQENEEEKDACMNTAPSVSTVWSFCTTPGVGCFRTAG